MVSAVTMYRTADGQIFESEKAAVFHERQQVVEQRVRDLLLKSDVGRLSDLEDIVQAIIRGRAELQGAFYFLQNG